MDIYMINTGSRYTLYYNPPKQEPKAAGPKRHCFNLASRIENAEAARAGLTTKEFMITTDLGESVSEAYRDVAESVKRGMQQLGSKMRTKTSRILKDAAYAETAILNYSGELSEDKARRFFSRIVKKEKLKSWLIFGACAIAYIASWNPFTMLVPTIFVLGPAIGYQIAVINTLRKGVKNILFVPNPEVSKLEKIISGEKGLGLTSPDLIDYRVAKGL
ncbi:MAG: hypothetical protein V1734_04040 [Nanoarchaeota archaeon]